MQNGGQVKTTKHSLVRGHCKARISARRQVAPGGRKTLTSSLFQKLKDLIVTGNEENELQGAIGKREGV